MKNLLKQLLSSNDWRPVHLRPKEKLRALIVIASPSNISDYAPDGISLTKIDVDGEFTRIQQSLQDIPITLLSSQSLKNKQSDPPTIEKINSHLRDGYDILYLVAHGIINKQDEPFLWLENAAGKADVVKGLDLVWKVRDLSKRPRLVVLASCQSAPTDMNQHSSYSIAVGPRLVEVGVPSVIAMQGNITIETIERFMPTFFRELMKDGQLDRAMAVAREEVHSLERHDWWIPVLFTRLKKCCIWNETNAGENAARNKSFGKWPKLIQDIKNGKCTPVIGTHLSELLGTQIEIAQRWSQEYDFPLEPYRCEHLSQVAQFLSVNQEEIFPQENLLILLKDELWRRYKNKLSYEMKNAPLNKLFEEIGKIRRKENEQDPYRVLAEKPFPIYITANFTNLLYEALEEVGKKPRQHIFQWKDELRDINLPSITNDEDETDYEPDVQNPLVCHLFGHIDYPDTLVITEDDYFSHIMGIVKHEDRIPKLVLESLKDTGLLFLGFQPDDWDFRILLHKIKNLGSGGMRRFKKRSHVSVQITPDDNRILEPEGALHYLKMYFSNTNIHVFWGTVDDFVQKLMKQIEKSEQQEIWKQGL